MLTGMDVQFARTGIIASTILYLGANFLSFYTMFLLVVMFLHRKRDMVITHSPLPWSAIILVRICKTRSACYLPVRRRVLTMIAPHPHLLGQQADAIMSRLKLCL